jgi:tetratricopeptide (TPR) repeat protein
MYQWHRGYAAWKRSDWAKVISRYGRLHELGTANSAVTAALGTAFAQTGRWEEALSVFEEIGDQCIYGEFFVERWYNHAFALYELGRDQEAFQLVRHSIKQMHDGEGKDKADVLLVAAAIRPLGAFDGRDGIDWSGIAGVLVDLREHGFDSNYLNLELGTAQLSMGNAEAAIATLESIDGRMGDARSDCKSVLVKARAFYEVGRLTTARELITGAVDHDWSVEERGHAERLIQLISSDQSSS